MNGLTSSISKMRLDHESITNMEVIRRSNSQNLKLQRQNDPNSSFNLFKTNEDRSISMITKIDNTSEFGPLIEDEQDFLREIQSQINSTNQGVVDIHSSQNPQTFWFNYTQKGVKKDNGLILTANIPQNNEKPIEYFFNELSSINEQPLSLQNNAFS